MISAQRVVGNGSSLFLCPAANGKAPQHRPPLRSGKLIAYKNNPQKRSVPEGLMLVFSFYIASANFLYRYAAFLNA